MNWNRVSMERCEQSKANGRGNEVFIGLHGGSLDDRSWSMTRGMMLIYMDPGYTKVYYTARPDAVCPANDLRLEDA